MDTRTQLVRTFPSAQIPSQCGGLPIEVSLIAQLGHGSGNQLFENAMARQRAHAEFVDALDEPSARLGGIDLQKGDPTSLYSFAVGAKGHPFHRHAGHRVFTAISGSGGAQLRFSTASDAQIETDPHSFVAALHCVNIPPDCLFTVRFGGDTWHQFAPLQAGSRHPVFFALSCHTNELGGNLPESVRERVIANAATIPGLTELLPQPVLDILGGPRFDFDQVPTTALALDAPAGSVQSAFCRLVRGTAGRFRGLLARWRGVAGFATRSQQERAVESLRAPSPGSLLLEQFAGQRVHHEDTFQIILDAREIGTPSASFALAGLLDGFLENPPPSVTRMMAVRNALVRPLGLRTSSLGCPVSSLLSWQKCQLFAQRFPVLAQSTREDGRRCQVVLGADDKHLRFRSCVGIEFLDDRRVAFTLGTRVQFRNLFGRLYMAMIDRVHRGYVTPTMMRRAVDHVAGVASVTGFGSSAPVSLTNG